MFKNALAAIQSPPSIPFSVLLSMDGLRLGDICFAKIQTTLHMWTVSIAVLERWIANGSFNPECMAEGNHSGSITLLIILNPNQEGTELKSASIGLIVRWHMGPVGHINDIMRLIKYTCSQMRVDWQTSDNTCRTFCIIVGDYGGHMGFATDLLFCTAYPLSFVHKDNPAQMTPRSQQNHPTSFPADVLLVCQLLTQDCSPHEYTSDRCHRHLLIPRGVHFLPNLFPQIVVPHEHATPYRDPQSGEEVPFVAVGPFVSMDTLFSGTPGDLELFTDEEVIALSNVGVLKSTITGTSTPKMPPLASHVEPDSPSKKRGCRDSLSHRHPVTMATGSCGDLGKSEHKCEATRKQLQREIGVEHGHPKSRDLTVGCITRDERSPAPKHCGSVDTGASGECPHLKERHAKEVGPANVDAQTCQSVFLHPSFYPLLRLPPPPLLVHPALHPLTRAGDLLPWVERVWT